MPVKISGDGTITGLTVGGLPNGVVDENTLANLAVGTGKLANNAVTPAKSALTEGITHYDTWGLTANVNWSGHNVFDSAFDRNTSVPSIGAAMTKGSGGVFTFPVTGIWEISFQLKVYDGTPNAWCECYIEKSTNSGSSWTTVGVGDGSLFDDNQATYCTPACRAAFDVTNTSTFKVRLSINNEQGAVVEGHATNCASSVVFKRIGNT